MNVFRRVLVALVIPLLGYLLGATIFNHFYNQVEAGDLARATLVATPVSCARRGPVAWRGFGFFHECQVEVRVRSSGETYRSSVTGWLAPEDVGEQYAVHTVRHGRPLQPDVRSEGQVFLGWLCTLVFGIGYLVMNAWIARYVWPDAKPRKRRVPTRYQPPQP